MGTNPNPGSSPRVYEFQVGLEIPGWLTSRHNADYPSRVSGTPTDARVDASDKLHSLYLTRRDLVQRHEPSIQNFIHVHECISRLWGSQRNLTAGSEPIGAQALY